MTTPRPAATAILLRETDKPYPFEVLLLRRSKAVVFAGGFWVFPGGAIDPEDFSHGLSIDDCDDTELLEAVRRAAVRETQEESGIDIGEQHFVFYSHWTTPVQEPKRFSTWFMMAQAPAQHDVTVDNSEITEHQWLAPAEALLMLEKGELAVMPPAYICLLELSACNNIDAAMDFAQRREVPYFLPKLHKQGDGYLTLYTGDVAYDGGDLNGAGEHHRMEIRGKSIKYINTLNRSS